MLNACYVVYVHVGMVMVNAMMLCVFLMIKAKGNAAFICSYNHATVLVTQQGNKVDI